MGARLLIAQLREISELIGRKNYADALALANLIPDEKLKKKLQFSCLLNLGRYDDAEKIELTEEEDTFHLRGILFLKQNRFEDAFAEFKKSLEIRPDYAPAYEGIGDVLQALESVEQGVEFYVKAFDLDPSQNILKEKIITNVWERSGGCKQTGMCCHSVQLQFKGVALNSPEQLAQAQQVEPMFLQWQFQGHDARGQGSFKCKHVTGKSTCGIYEDRPELCRQYPMKPGYKDCGYQFRLRPDLPVIKNLVIVKEVGRLALHYGRFMDALKILFPLQSEGDAEIQNMLGTTYFCLKRYADAKTSYRKAIKLNPKFALAWVNLGDCYFEETLREKAKECYEKAVKVKPDFLLAQRGLEKLVA
jgi:tetratricopeptide (TPR) repeat protein